MPGESASSDGDLTTGVLAELGRTRLAGTRFRQIRFAAVTGSTNADVLELARQGGPEGLVVVAGVQEAGRGRQGRTWTAPAGSALLVSVLLRAPQPVAGLATVAVGVAAVDALGELGVEARLKWPNDVVAGASAGASGLPTVPERKLAGILAEADWPPAAEITGGWTEPAATERTVVVAGMGLNVNWPEGFDPRSQPGLEAAVAMSELAGHPFDRADVLARFLTHLDGVYGQLAGGDRAGVLHLWRARSATLGAVVRVDVGTDDVVGTAVDVTDEGHLVVEALEGGRRVIAAGDVVHLRPGG